jgi:hypothetical protein
MRRQTWSGLVAGVVLAACACGARAADTTYEVKLNRPVKVGEKFAVSQRAALERAMRVTPAGGVAQLHSEKLEAALDAAMEVQAVEDDGSAKSMHLTVKKLTLARDGEEAVEALKPGSEIDVAIGEKEVAFAMKDGQLSQVARTALETVYHPHTTKKTDDDLFGTTQRQPVGASWAMNTKLIAEQMPGMKMDPAKTSGSAKLVGVKETSGVQMLEVNAAFDSKDAALKGLPGAVKESTIRGEFETEVPVDTSDPSRTSQIKMVVHAVSEIPARGNTPAATIQLDGTVTAKSAQWRVK